MLPVRGRKIGHLETACFKKDPSLKPEKVTAKPPSNQVSKQIYVPKQSEVPKSDTSIKINEGKQVVNVESVRSHECY